MWREICCYFQGIETCIRHMPTLYIFVYEISTVHNPLRALIITFGPRSSSSSPSSSSVEGQESAGPLLDALQFKFNSKMSLILTHKPHQVQSSSSLTCWWSLHVNCLLCLESTIYIFITHYNAFVTFIMLYFFLTKTDIIGKSNLGCIVGN